MKCLRRPVDVLCLSLYCLSIYFSNEIARGYCGIGNYTLKEQHLDMALHADHLDLREQYTMESIIETWTTNMDPIIERAALTCESASLSSGSDSDSTANPSNSDCNSPGTIACLASGSDSNIGTDSNDEEITKSPPVVTLKSTKSTNPSETLLELFTDEDSSTVTVGNSVGKAKIIDASSMLKIIDETLFFKIYLKRRNCEFRKNEKS